MKYKQSVNSRRGYQFFDGQSIANTKAQAFKKLRDYFNYLKRTDYYTKKVKSFRKKYKIPDAGFKNDWDEKATYPTPLEKEMESKYKTFLPKKYELAEKICKHFNLYIADWEETIFDDLLYGSLCPHGYDTLVGNNLCRIYDLKSNIFDEYLAEGRLKEIPHYDESLLSVYPLSILISPYASLRDMRDYVSKIYPLIKFAQDRYRRKKNIKIGKIKPRNPNIQTRDEFIYQNRDKTGKEIAKMVKEKFGGKLLPYEYIPKIISREKKKRQKV